MLNNRKVNLFVVGAPKCGTSAWVEYLSKHPEVQFCSKKEPHYFSEDFPRFRWANSLDEYNKLFDNIQRQTKVIGEASIMYLYSNVAAEKIHAYNPHAKILVFLRDYVDFLSSYHRQLLNLLDEDEEDFAKAWQRQGERKQGRGVPKHCREPLFLQYREVASFAKQIDRYYKVFPRHQIKIICFEKWVANPRETYLDILNFLDLVDDGRQDFKKINVAKRQRFRVLARMTRRPPRFLLDMATLLKRFLGVERLNLAKSINSLNEKNVIVEKIQKELQDEIRMSMQDDAVKVRQYTDCE